MVCETLCKGMAQCTEGHTRCST